MLEIGSNARSHGGLAYSEIECLRPTSARALAIIRIPSPAPTPKKDGSESLLARLWIARSVAQVLANWSAGALNPASPLGHELARQRRIGAEKRVDIAVPTWSPYGHQRLRKCQLEPIGSKNMRHINYFTGAGCRNRTRDLLITNQLLYQLS